MRFRDAIRVCLTQKFVTFSGRASRSEFWWYFLFHFMALFGVGLVLELLGPAVVSNFPNSEGDVALFIFLGAIGALFLVSLLPVISVLVRRFRDRNLSGWWVLAYLVLSSMFYIGILVNIAALVICLLKGSVGENRFGDDPLALGGSTDVFA